MSLSVTASPREVQDWLLRVQPTASADQFDVLQRVATRVCKELEEGRSQSTTSSDPLVWASICQAVTKDFELGQGSAGK